MSNKTLRSRATTHQSLGAHDDRPENFSRQAGDCMSLEQSTCEINLNLSRQTRGDSNLKSLASCNGRYRTPRSSDRGLDPVTITSEERNAALSIICKAENRSRDAPISDSQCDSTNVALEEFRRCNAKKENRLSKATSRSSHQTLAFSVLSTISAVSNACCHNQIQHSNRADVHPRKARRIKRNSSCNILRSLFRRRPVRLLSGHVVISLVLIASVFISTFSVIGFVYVFLVSLFSSFWNIDFKYTSHEVSRTLNLTSPPGYSRNGVSLPKSPFVQNENEIRYVLELTRKQYHPEERGNYRLISVRDEEQKSLFETIFLPTNTLAEISVPKFYASVSVEDDKEGHYEDMLFRQWTSGKLLTPDLASMVGTIFSDKDKKGESSLLRRTIFISIMSQSHWQCPHTISSLFKAATNPHRVRVGVVDLTNSNSEEHTACDTPPKPCDVDANQALCEYKSNVDVYELDSDFDAGTTFLRHIANRLYRGEDYAFQLGSDPKISFSEGWDEELIEQLESTGNEMAIITTYLSVVNEHVRQESRSNISPSNAIAHVRPGRFTLCHASYVGDGPNRRLNHLRSDQIEQEAPISRRSTPMLQPFWASEFSFSRGHFILTVPYDPYLCGIDDQDEEISMALRAFTHGYDFYTPTKSVVFKRASENEKDKNLRSNGNRSQTCKGHERNSLLRLYSFVKMMPEDTVPTWDSTGQDIYGIGSVRLPSKFLSCFGIHVRERITEQKLCDFVVSGNMHDEFTAKLRKNGMGINYDEINFRFHELISIHKDNY